MKRNVPSSTRSRSASLLAAAAALLALQACSVPGVRPTSAAVVDTTIPSLDSLRPATPEPSENLALHRPATASASLPDQSASAALDGDAQTVWNAGAHAPQWIEIDLGAAFDLDRVILTVAQDPRGGTVHQISGRGETGDYRLLYKFHEDTGDGLELDVSPVAGWAAVRYLKIETTESPSWVAWREIAVFGRSLSHPLAQVGASRAWPTSIAPQS
jgi:F5/8 type C domain